LEGKGVAIKHLICVVVYALFESLEGRGMECFGEGEIYEKMKRKKTFIFIERICFLKNDKLMFMINIFLILRIL